jgi:hypothetical protein
MDAILLARQVIASMYCILRTYSWRHKIERYHLIRGELSNYLKDILSILNRSIDSI